MNTKESGSHSFEVSEAVRLGSTDKAILLKEITRMSVYKVRTKKSPWVWYSGAALCEKFPYMSQRSIERWMRELEEANELVSRVKNKNKYDKTKSYTTPEFTKIPILIDSQTGDEYIVSMDAQNGESNEKNGESTAHSGEPIPPLSSSDTPLSELGSSQVLSSSKEKTEYTTVACDENGMPIHKKQPQPADTQYKEVFALFSSTPQGWMYHKAQIDAAKRLLKLKGIDQVRKAMVLYREYKEDSTFTPSILKPFDLEQKWDNLLAWKRKNNL